MVKTRKSKGFTLIELMIVVAIIGILAAVAIPKFADLVTKSKEASVKGNLGAVRSAISIYYGDLEGAYPGNLFTALTTGNRYMPAVSGVPSLGMFDIPKHNNSTGNPGHGFGSASAIAKVTEAAAPTVTDTTAALAYGWNGGEVVVNCLHVDTKGSAWSAY